MSENIKVWTEFQDVSWDSVLKNPVILGSHYQIVPTEGYLAWEYNPLRNYRLSTNMYEKDGKYYSEKEFRDIEKDIADTDELPEGWILREAGELVDFITDELSFNLQYPVDILPQYSYDGSVNLILNDGLNIPRLINTRFTTTGLNTYKIVDRKGDNDTNIYDQGSQFDVDTSLFKNVNKIPKLEYIGTSMGNMKIGNYHFYFKYADADGNESDWVAESGLVSVFMGNSPKSVNTGLRDENSIKSVRFKLSNIDLGYSFVKVYYTRYSGDVDSNLVTHAKKIEKNFIVNNQGVCDILITGDELEVDVTLEEINSSFDVVQNAKTQCTVQNRLFMANIHKQKIEYDVLSKLSLCFCPYKYEEDYPLSDNGITENYEIISKSDGYYNSKFIYDKTSYWPGELYRLGVVYILKDGSLSPVFNIRGATKIPVNKLNNGKYYYSIEEDIYNEENSIEDILHDIKYSDENYFIDGGIAPNENAKGVIQLDETPVQAGRVFPLVGVNITTSNKIIEALKKYTKGFFFVRQKRMPLTMCQGIVVGLDNESRTPTLPTLEGILSNVQSENSFVETEDINDINYISEGFLGRYYYKYAEKKSNYWKKIGIALGTIAVLAAAVAVAVVTCGVGFVAFGVATATAVIGAAAADLAVIGIVAGMAAAASILTVSLEEADIKVRQKRNKKEVKKLKGRQENIPEGYERKEKEDSRKIIQDLDQRYIIKDPSKNTASAVIVPDYQVNSPYYNQFFIGDAFKVRLAYEQPNTNYLNDGYFESNQRHFYTNDYVNQSDTRFYDVKLIGVPDGCPIKMIGEQKYKARAGFPEEAFRYEFVGISYDDAKNKIDNSDIIRGNFGSYVGMDGYEGHACDQINIMIPGYQENKLYDYVQLRAQDTSAFYAISDRIDINNLNKPSSILEESISEIKHFDQIYYRGDSYVCQYTHRIIRNFNDPSAPYNDTIVDEDCWKENYDPDNTEKYAKINLGDVNAVQLGLWLTFKLRSNYNLNIRTIDKSNVDEYLMCGNYRSFYPNYGQLADGNQKIPDSDQYNKGFSKSVSEKYYFEVPDVPYIKQEFQNRIVFSDIHINDAYKNGFRVIRTMNHKDYQMTYGSITKMLDYNGALVIVFEHGVGLVTVNSSAEHTSQILGELNMISDTYGSQWKDSIIKTPSGIYGVDTIAKKIWRVQQGQIQLISDLHVQEFLNNNISLSERELTPIIGIRNVKTVYNAFKHDVMFTFYDSLYGVHEKSWNLCWNEMQQIFTTFYSWIPSDMLNIDNIPFSFNRETVKAIAKLGISNHDNDFSDGVTLTNNVLNISQKDLDMSFTVNNKDLCVYYLNPAKEWVEYTFEEKPKENTVQENDGLENNTKENEFYLDDIINEDGFIGFLNLDNRSLPDAKVKYQINYTLQRDNYRNDKIFTIKTCNIKVKETKTLLQKEVTSIPVSYLVLDGDVKNLLSELYYRNSAGHSHADIDANKYNPKEGININYPIFKNKSGKRLMLNADDQINPDQIIRYLNIKASIKIASSDNPSAEEFYYNSLIGEDASMIDAGYFESQVAITTDYNLSLLSTDFWKHGQAGLIDITDKIHPTNWYGKQHPFEFECIVADNPQFHKIFTNLEILANHVQPESFHYEVVGDTYDFANDKPNMYFRQEALKALYQYNGFDIEYNSNFLEIEPKQNNRSADLPKYYFRKDSINEIYDSYKRIQAPKNFNYDHLSGAEIVYYPTRNEFRVWNHAQAINVDSMRNGIETSIIKANCRYLEDKWLVTINPIIITYNNEFNTTNTTESIFEKDANGYYKYSTWIGRYENKDLPLLPPLNISQLKICKENSDMSENIEFPDYNKPKDNALHKLYDLTNWENGKWEPLNPIPMNNRRETDVRGKFIKIRIRYKGDQLAIIDLLNTIYQISFA